MCHLNGFKVPFAYVGFLYISLLAKDTNLVYMFFSKVYSTQLLSCYTLRSDLDVMPTGMLNRNCSLIKHA